jgi:hypothetical protein
MTAVSQLRTRSVNDRKTVDQWPYLSVGIDIDFQLPSKRCNSSFQTNDQVLTVLDLPLGSVSHSLVQRTKRCGGGMQPVEDGIPV